VSIHQYHPNFSHVFVIGLGCECAQVSLFDESLIEIDIDKQKYRRYVEILYRQLKSKFQQKKDYNLADDFLHGEYRMKLKQKKNL